MVWGVLLIDLPPDCPVSEGDDYRLEVLVALRQLERLDKDQYTEDERADAEEVCPMDSCSLFMCVWGGGRGRMGKCVQVCVCM